MPELSEDIRKIALFSTKNFGDISFNLENQISPTLEMANGIVEDVASIALYVGIGFAAFAGIMLSNFIGSSVTRQKLKIGILRALGARSNDVFKIFFSESLLIALISFLVSAAVSYFVIFYINQLLRDRAGLRVTIFDYGVRQIAFLLAINVFVATVSSYLHIRSIASKRPVDAIRNK